MSTPHVDLGGIFVIAMLRTQAWNLCSILSSDQPRPFERFRAPELLQIWQEVGVALTATASGNLLFNTTESPEDAQNAAKMLQVRPTPSLSPWLNVIAAV